MTRLESLKYNIQLLEIQNNREDAIPKIISDSKLIPHYVTNISSSDETFFYLSYD